MQEHNSCVHYAALSALSCVHEDIKNNGVGHLVEASTPAFIGKLIAALPGYTRKNVRQTYETLIQAVQTVAVCLEDPDVVKVRSLLNLARIQAVQTVAICLEDPDVVRVRPLLNLALTQPALRSSCLLYTSPSPRD